MSKKMKKLLAIVWAVSLVFTLVSIPASAKKKAPAPKPKIVSLKYSVFNNMKAGKQTIKVSWNAVKATGRVDILNASKKVVKKIWQKKITKKGSASLTWDGKSGPYTNVSNGTYYVKFTLGKKSVMKKFSVKSVQGLMSFKNVTMQCPPGYKLSYSYATGMAMYETSYSSSYNVDILGLEENLMGVDFWVEQLSSEDIVDENNKAPVANGVSDVTIQGVLVKKVDIEFEKTAMVYYIFSHKVNTYVFGFNYQKVNEEKAVEDIQKCIDSIQLK